MSYIPQAEQHLPFGHMLLRLEKVSLVCCSVIWASISMAAMQLCAVTMHESQKNYTLSQAINLTLLVYERANQLSGFCLGKLSRGEHK